MRGMFSVVILCFYRRNDESANVYNRCGIRPEKLLSNSWSHYTKPTGRWVSDSSISWFSVDGTTSEPQCQSRQRCRGPECRISLAPRHVQFPSSQPGCHHS
uniref:Pco131239 n=1 Tax=Arundo donax TaxID=35708 RepID=A0A0A9GIN3_ARUDO